MTPIFDALAAERDLIDAREVAPLGLVTPHRYLLADEGDYSDEVTA